MRPGFLFFGFFSAFHILKNSVPCDPECSKTMSAFCKIMSIYKNFQKKNVKWLRENSLFEQLPNEPFTYEEEAWRNPNPIQQTRPLRWYPKKEGFQKTIVYVYGGGFVSEGFGLSSRIVKHLHNKFPDHNLMIPDYPLAPEFNFNDITQYVADCLNQCQGDIIVIACSAGAAIAYAAIEKFDSKDRIKAMICCSPLIDIAMRPEISEKVDCLTTGDYIKWTVSHLRFDEKDNPYVFLQNKKEEQILKTLVIYCEDEILADDARFIYSLSKTTEKFSIPKGYHGFHYAYKILPEGRRAVNKMDEFIAHVLSSADSSS